MKTPKHSLGTTFKNILLYSLGVVMLFTITFYAKPYFSPYFINQGLQLTEKRRYNEAMFFLNTAFFLHPEEYRVLHNLGKIYHYRRLYPLAAEKLKSAVKMNPYFIDSYRLLSQCYEKINRYDLALGTLTSALEIEPNNREIAHSIEDIKKVYIADQISKAAELYAQANISETKSKLQKASELSGDSFYNLFILENEAPRGENIEEQINRLEVLSKVEEKDTTTYQLIANMLVENKDFKRAVEYYKRCLLVKPNNIALHNNLAAASFLSGQVENAVKEYRIALSFEPDNEYVIYGLARSFEASNLTEEAERLYRFLIEKDTQRFYVSVDLARLSTKQSNFQEARIFLEKAIDSSEAKLSQDKEDKMARYTFDKAQKELTDLAQLQEGTAIPKIKEE